MLALVEFNPRDYALQLVNDRTPTRYPASDMNLTEFSEKLFQIENNSPMHLSWHKDLTVLYNTAITHKGPRFGCIIAPPEHGKSYTTGVIFPC